MSMIFCRGCGKEIHETASTCPHCGAPQGITPQATRNTPNESGPITESWKIKFSLIEKAGGPKLTKVRDLAFGERMKVVFNIWGFLFGPFYYLAKGMWKKAVVYFSLCIVAILIIEFILDKAGISTTITSLIAPAVFATKANIDYYRKIILNEDEWL